MVAKDGEGLTKFVTLEIAGAESRSAARRIGLAIANSPLVKTALAGNDPNWGRIVMAVGKSGEAADRDKLAIWFGDIPVARDGEVHAGYREELGADYVKRRELTIRVDVGCWQEHGDGLDLRPHLRLRRYQRRLSQLSAYYRQQIVSI